MAELKDRPAYVRFETRAVEDRAASIAAGGMKTKDVDYVVITPVGTKDEIPRVVSEWLSHLKVQVQQERLPDEHRVHYNKCYEAWKAGQELPVEGTPLRIWPVISPSQLANCLSANVRTVEDLASMNGEAATRIGMGAVELKQKAEAWLKGAKDIGVVVQMNSALTTENARLKGEVAGLQKKLDEANAALKSAAAPKVPA